LFDWNRKQIPLASRENCAAAAGSITTLIGSGERRTSSLHDAPRSTRCGLRRRVPDARRDVLIVIVDARRQVSAVAAAWC
jgi:hypothetical protein